MKKWFIALVAVSCVVPAPAVFSKEAPQSQPVIVTATRTPALEESIGKTVSVITQSDIEAEKTTNLPEALQQTPGLRIQQLGGPGTFTDIRIRGLRSFDTQFLINSLPLRDASDPQGSFNGLSQDLKTDFFKQIDVVRGASATIYGSDSVGGTINLIPQQAEGKPSLTTQFEGGTLNTYKQSYSIQGGQPNFHYLAGYTRTTSDGIDANDDYDNNFYTTFLDFSPTENIEVGFNFVGSDTRLDLNDEATFVNGKLVTGANDPNDYKDSQFFFYGTYLKFQATDQWEHILRFGAVDANKKFVFLVDPDGSDFASKSEFNGNTYNIEYQTNYQLNESHLVTFGYEHEQEELEQITQDLGQKIKETPDQYQNDFYLQDQMNFLDETLFITGGIRITDHETAGTDVNGEGSIAYLIKKWGTKLHSHIGTGFRAPSLFELFGATTFGGLRTLFGNTKLDPENSLSWDIGFDQKLFQDKAELGVTFFQQDFDKIIGFGALGYTNIKGADSLGIEADLKVQITPTLMGRAFYTFTDSKDTNGQKVLGIPEHLWGAHVVWNFLKKFTLSVKGTYKGKDDFNVFIFAPAFNVVRVKSDDYFKVDAACSYQINPNAEVYVRAENIFNATIVENGFEGIPAMVWGGVKIKI